MNRSVEEVEGGGFYFPQFFKTNDDMTSRAVRAFSNYPLHNFYPPSKWAKIDVYLLPTQTQTGFFQTREIFGKNTSLASLANNLHFQIFER